MVYEVGMRRIKILSICLCLFIFPPFLCLIYDDFCWGMDHSNTETDWFMMWYHVEISLLCWLQKTGLALQETGVSMMTSMSYGQKNIWFPPCLATEVDTKAGVDGELPHCCCSFGNLNGLWYVSILLVWLWWFFFRSRVPLAALTTLHHQDGRCLTKQSSKLHTPVKCCFRSLKKKTGTLPLPNVWGAKM